MKSAELQDYLRTRIPLAHAMGVEVRSLGEAGIELYAPLAPNTNHRDTVFGGSASAVAILAACPHCTCGCAPRASKAAS